MNFLLGALFIAILLLPGILFRIGYLAIPFSSKSFKSSLLEELLFSLIPAFILQFAGYLITDALICEVNERTIYLTLINSDKAIAHGLSRQSLGYFALYSVLINIIAFGLGNAFRILSLKYRLHLRYSFLRIYNEWQLYFEGIVLDYPGEPGESSAIDQVWVDILVENKDESYIYSGLLHDYVIDKDEKIDRIYLQSVRRRKLSADENAAHGLADEQEASLQEVDYDDAEDISKMSAMIAETIDKRYYYMPGDNFMIPGKEIKNINITYYSIEI